MPKTLKKEAKRHLHQAAELNGTLKWQPTILDDMLWWFFCVLKGAAGRQGEL